MKSKSYRCIRAPGLQTPLAQWIIRPWKKGFQGYLSFKHSVNIITFYIQHITIIDINNIDINIHIDNTE